MLPRLAGLRVSFLQQLAGRQARRTQCGFEQGWRQRQPLYSKVGAKGGVRCEWPDASVVSAPALSAHNDT
nr:hypothetical protein HUO10_005362 [Paraburkholderia busanensis]